jgi:NADH:ubiquinone oxidoreductase subunit 4 (subunit M)
MAVCLLGLFSFNVQGLEGGLHDGWARVCCLFLCIGLLYDLIKLEWFIIMGLAQTMPLLASSMLILTMGTLVYRY